MYATHAKAALLVGSHRVALVVRSNVVEFATEDPFLDVRESSMFPWELPIMSQHTRSAQKCRRQKAGRTHSSSHCITFGAVQSCKSSAARDTLYVSVRAQTLLTMSNSCLRETSLADIAAETT